jgi:uncharacterized protein YciI
MRFLLAMSALCLAAAAPSSAEPAVERPAYDAALAQRLGADERGIRKYVLVILKRGPKEPASESERSKLFQGHMANINRLAAEGKLVTAGPLGKNDRGYSGIFVFNVADVAEADALVASDPAVAAGAFAYEAYGWYGSAALMEVNGIHGRIDKTGR